MSFCAEQIVLLAGNILTGIGAPSSQSVGLISGWITYSGNLGDLNTKLSICTYLTGDSPCIENFGPEEASIYALMYEMDYYRYRANVILSNGDNAPWLSISEGDTKVTREGTTQRAKVYIELAREMEEDLRIAVANWKKNHTFPVTIDGSSLYSYPTP